MCWRTVVASGACGASARNCSNSLLASGSAPAWGEPRPEGDVLWAGRPRCGLRESRRDSSAAPADSAQSRLLSRRQVSPRPNYESGSDSYLLSAACKLLWTSAYFPFSMLFFARCLSFWTSGGAHRDSKLTDPAWSDFTDGFRIRMPRLMEPAGAGSGTSTGCNRVG